MAFDLKTLKSLSDDERQAQLVVLLSSKETFSQTISSFDDFMSLWTSCSVAEQHLIWNRLDHMPDEWQRLVPRGYDFADLYGLAPEGIKAQMFERLFEEGEWQRLVTCRFAFADLYGLALESIKFQMFDRLFAEEGEWQRLVMCRFAFAHLYGLAPESIKVQMFARLLEEGEWQRLVTCCFAFADLYGLAPEDIKVQMLLRLLVQNEGEALGLAYYFRLGKVKELIAAHSEEGSQLWTLSDATSIVDLQERIHRIIGQNKVRRVARLFGQAIRTGTAQCHLGRMPLEVFNLIGSFAVHDLDSASVKSVVEDHMGRPPKPPQSPEAESGDASGAAAAGPM